MSMFSTLLALQTLYLIDKHKKEEEEEDNKEKDDDDFF